MFKFKLKKPSNPPKFLKKKRFWVIAIIVLLIIIAVVSNLLSAGKKANVNLPVFPAAVSDLSDTIKLSGNVKTVFLTEVTTKAEGIVSKVYVENGQQVKQGEKLFEIELSPESKQQAQSAYNSYLTAKNSLATTETSLHNLQTQLARADDSYDDYVDDDKVYTFAHCINDGKAPLTCCAEANVDYNKCARSVTGQSDGREIIYTDTDYLQVVNDSLTAQEDYKNTQDRITTAKQGVNTSYLNYQQYASAVTAPASGEVSGIAVTEGMMISNTDEASQRLAVVKTGDSLLIQLDVNELDIGKIKVGQQADVVLTATGDAVYQGQVLSIDQIGVNANGTPSYPVLIGFTAPEDSVILPNMSADVTIKINNVLGVLAVSSLAINHDETGYYVNLITDYEGVGDKATPIIERRSVEIGLQTEDLTEIKAGLQEGDQVQMNDFNAMFQSNDLQRMLMGGPPAGAGGEMQVYTTTTTGG